MLALNEAVSKSLLILKETFAVPTHAAIELEEARLHEEPNEWLLTFSYPDPAIADEPSNANRYLARALRGRRAYKEIRIKANDGEVTGVRNLHL